MPRAPRSTLFPYTTLFRSVQSSCSSDFWARVRIEINRRLPVVLSRSRKLLFAWMVLIACVVSANAQQPDAEDRSEEHTSELQSRQYLVCRLLLEKKKSTN